MDITPEITKAFSAAKIALMQRPDSVFFTTVCFSLKHVWDDTIPTACTDGKEIRFNPEFFMSLNKEERIFLMLHESMHVAFMHTARFETYKSTNHSKFNIAADHVINLMLIDRGFKMPQCGYADQQYTGMCVEEVMKLLPDDPPNEKWMDIKSGAGSLTEEEDINDILVRAVIQSKMDGDKAGSIPGEVEIYVEKLLNPTLPWNRILQKYLYAKAKNDYSFKRPNRRFFPAHILPSLYSEALTNIAIAVDTSGSVSPEEFSRFVSEVSNILKMLHPEKINLIQFDTTIKSVTPIRNITDLKRVKFIGRGGTDIRELLSWVSDNKPQVVLVFSDGYFRTREQTGKSDYVWIIHNNPSFTTPKGKVIHYTI